MLSTKHCKNWRYLKDQNIQALAFMGFFYAVRGELLLTQYYADAVISQRIEYLAAIAAAQVKS